MPDEPVVSSTEPDDDADGYGDVDDDDAVDESDQD